MSKKNAWAKYGKIYTQHSHWEKLPNFKVWIQPPVVGDDSNQRLNLIKCASFASVRFVLIMEFYCNM